MTVQRLKTGKGYNRAVIVPHSNPIKPLLEEVHRSARVYYARSKLDLHTGLYDGFYQSVHIDEKWFFITQEQLYLYLSYLEIEEGRVPVRRVPHKSHIGTYTETCLSASSFLPLKPDFPGAIKMW
jgi:hypothetical protein